MIVSIKHKALRRLFEHDDARGVIADHAEKLRDILAVRHSAREIADIDLSGLRKAKLATLTMLITINGDLNYADEKSPPSRWCCVTPVY